MALMGRATGVPQVCVSDESNSYKMEKHPKLPQAYRSRADTRSREAGVPSNRS